MICVNYGRGIGRLLIEFAVSELAQFFGFFSLARWFCVFFFNLIFLRTLAVVMLLDNDYNEVVDLVEFSC